MIDDGERGPAIGKSGENGGCENELGTQEGLASLIGEGRVRRHADEQLAGRYYERAPDLDGGPGSPMIAFECSGPSPSSRR